MQQRQLCNKFVLLTGMLLAGTALGAKTNTLEAPLVNSDGKTIGQVELTQLENGVKIELQARGLPPGEHAIHLHEIGQCTTPDFKSAGGHYNPTGAKHGFDVKRGPHAGDMPNVIVEESGELHTEIVNSKVSLKNGPNPLLKKGGTALVLHAGPDDYRSQPSGDAGGRIACAEIRKR